MAADRRHTIEVGGTRLALHEWGDEQATALVHWPGLGTYTGEYLFELGPLLARHGVRVIALDPPGIGDSPKLPPDRYRADDLAGLLPLLLDALGLDSAFLMGHSWGAVIAVEAAWLLRDRARGLVLLDGGYFDQSAVPAWQVPLEEHLDRARAEEWRFDDEEAFRAELRRHYARVTPELERYWLGTMENRDGQLVDTADPEPMGAGLWGLAQPRAPVAPRLAELAVPVLLLLAEPRPVSESEGAELGMTAAEWGALKEEGIGEFQRLPQATTIVVPDAGHDLIGDAGPRVAELVGEWLATVR